VYAEAVMLSKLFMGISLVGAEWVLYFLVLVSVYSVALILERLRFYFEANKGAALFRSSLRRQLQDGSWAEALKTVQKRIDQRAGDLESEMALALLNQREKASDCEVLNELAQDSMTRSRLIWEKNLAVLATIGSNAPFVGLFGTVLGIIKAFHDLSQQVGAGAQTVTAGISEALVATAVGILVAIPAVVAFNLFQRKVKSAKAEAEALKSYLIACLSSQQKG